MPELRVICRVVTYNPATRSILLVRNHGQKWWCAPGGGWGYTQETILECAKREAFEESGIRVNITRLLYVQTIYLNKQNSIRLEQFWLAEPVGSIEIPQKHVDQFGTVDEAHWFNYMEIQAITVYPEILKKSFWDSVSRITEENNRYLGHFVL